MGKLDPKSKGPREMLSWHDATRKCYTKASASIKIDEFRERSMVFIRGVDLRSLLEDPPANRRFPSRVPPSGEGGLAYARHFPRRIASG